MFQLLYVSAATHLLSDAELDEILAVSRRNNTRDGVTGLLLYADGAFFQVLEGEEAAVRDLYGRIAQDPRHHRLLNIFQRGIDQRDFPEWSMGFQRVETLADLPPAFFALTAQRMNDVANERRSDDVVTMLKTFAKVNMRA